MRYAVLVLAVLGCISAGFLGTKWLSDASLPESKVILEFIRNDPEELAKDPEFRDRVAGLKSSDVKTTMLMALAAPAKIREAKNEPKFREAAGKLEGAIRAAYFLLLALPLGLAGGTLGFFRKKYAAAGMLIGAVVLPTIFMPLSLVFSCPLLIAGILAFLVGPEMPISRKKPVRRDEED
jgi:hypothetical protein